MLKWMLLFQNMFLQLTEVLTVERTAWMASVKSYLNHTVSYLRTWGIPENNRIQVGSSTEAFRRSSP